MAQLSMWDGVTSGARHSGDAASHRPFRNSNLPSEHCSVVERSALGRSKWTRSLSPEPTTLFHGISQSCCSVFFVILDKPFAVTNSKICKLKPENKTEQLFVHKGSNHIALAKMDTCIRMFANG